MIRAAALAFFFVFAPSLATAAPVKVVHDTLEVPAGMDAADALATVEDLAGLFDRYEPAVPWVPGVKLALAKEVVSASHPVVLSMPVDGAAFGRAIEEEARITATTRDFVCRSGEMGRQIDLSFDGSSHNVARRVDRIEITACPRTVDGHLVIDARGKLYAGFLPRDPELNGLQESVGAKAIQSAFMGQVPAVFDAVRQTWATRS